MRGATTTLICLALALLYLPHAFVSAAYHPRNMTIHAFDSYAMAISMDAVSAARNAGYKALFGARAIFGSEQKHTLPDLGSYWIFDTVGVIWGDGCYNISGPFVLFTFVATADIAEAMGMPESGVASVVDTVGSGDMGTVCMTSDLSVVPGCSEIPNVPISGLGYIDLNPLLLSGVSVKSGATIGRGAVLGVGVSVKENATIGNGAVISPSTSIQEFASIGAGAYIGHSSKIGECVSVDAWTLISPQTKINDIDNCPEAILDYDADGFPDYIDGCPRDGEKHSPGICGCGRSDGDEDGDGIPDCLDGCPQDPNKRIPGACGCGAQENCFYSNGTARGPHCGNGIVEPRESCDDGFNNGTYGGCNPGCGSRAPRCGDGIVQRPIETCDDRNTVSGDGCSASCQVEEGWLCLRNGRACTPKEQTGCDGVLGSGKQLDCAGVCDGFAVLDDCGVCAGGTTGIVFNSALDMCGVCFGNNSAMDSCGICFGDDSEVDACGVCFGRNTSCLGCNGLPNSAATVDVCGVCGGDNSTCMGCDGVPIPVGGKTYDVCGECGGTATTCMIGCDGVLGSALAFDCAGICNGTAQLDSCGFCAGGSTGFLPILDPAVCPSPLLSGGRKKRGTCSSSLPADACGVCGGDNSTCMGCDGVPIPVGGKTYDVCGECGGTATTCMIGCDGVLGSSLMFDCAGICNGNAQLDSCGICFGPNLGITLPDLFVDACGVCFGGNLGVDACGQCDGNNALMDACGVCGGLNESLSQCGECFAQTIVADQCGVCGGDGSSCIGCDGLFSTGSWVDSCEICRFADEAGCDPPVVVPSSSGGQQGLSLGAIAALVAVLVGAALAVSAGAVVFAMRKRALTKSQTPPLPAVSAAEEVELPAFSVVTTSNDVSDCIVPPPPLDPVSVEASFPEARPAQLVPLPIPQGDVCFVFTGVHNLAPIDNLIPQATEAALALHNAAMRECFSRHHGLEVAYREGSFMFAFSDPSDAVLACTAAQLALLDLEWPEEIVNCRMCPEERLIIIDEQDREIEGPLVCRGLRVCMGVHSGPAFCVVPQSLPYPLYAGQTVRKAFRTGAAARPGQILVTSVVCNRIRELIDRSDDDDNDAALAVEWLGAIDHPETIWQVTPRRIMMRQYIPLQTGGRSWVFPGVLDCFLRPDRRGSVASSIEDQCFSASASSLSRSSSFSSITGAAAAASSGLATRTPDGVWHLPLLDMGPVRRVQERILMDDL